MIVDSATAHPAATDVSQPDQETVDRIARTFAALIRGPRLQHLHRALNARAGIELDRPAYLALAILFDQSPLRISDLAEACGVEISTMSRLVRRLVTEGLLANATTTEDRRVVLVELSEAGQALVRRLKDERRAAVVEIMAHWTVAEQAAFADLLERFAQGLMDVTDPRTHPCVRTSTPD